MHKIELTATKKKMKAKAENAVNCNDDLRLLTVSISLV
mgnify:CR=1 FL=1